MEVPQLEEDYEDWKFRLLLWRTVCGIEKKYQASHVYLTLKNKAREAIRGITIEELQQDNGIELLLEKLDKVFLPDKAIRQFSTFVKIQDLQRKEDVLIMDHLLEFENTYK